ncbi:hypothetical protein [Klebsiella quasipneumoniae]|uniref:hypothetical protein n=1 Tax=Klebsiella quasipneumoniae TaxID=1463165 RepID=UPI003D36F40F
MAEKNGDESGSPVPGVIADKFRCCEFSNFHSFGRAFWKAVSDTTELTERFEQASLGSINLETWSFIHKMSMSGGGLNMN